jgi:hypothetical protein
VIVFWAVVRSEQGQPAGHGSRWLKCAKTPSGRYAATFFNE